MKRILLLLLIAGWCMRCGWVLSRILEERPPIELKLVAVPPPDPNPLAWFDHWPTVDVQCFESNPPTTTIIGRWPAEVKQ